MKIAICDDELIFHQNLKTAINIYAKKHGIDILYDDFTDGHSLISSKNEYDLIFMDYQMNGINGIETAKKLRNKNNKTTIIFLTSYPNIVFDVFEVNAFRFLVKPINTQKLSESMDDYLKTLDNSSYLIIKEDDIVKKIQIDVIIYAEASDKYCYIRTEDNNYLYKKTLSELEKNLPSDLFFRSHRTYLVGFKHIVTHTNTDISFDNNEKAIISKLKLPAFKSAFLNYIKRYNLGKR